MPHSQIKVAIIGAGISGLTVANGLLNDPAERFDVQIYERDDVAFDSERGGYQLRIASNGLQGLRTASDADLWSRLQDAWAGDTNAAPAVVDPKHFNIHLMLSNYKAYPTSRPVPRTSLRYALLQKPMVQERVHFGYNFERFEHVRDGEKSVMLYFDQGRSEKVDLLIAADGSNSQINRQVGLQNKIKLNGWKLIQARDVINAAQRERLPASLKKCGSVMFLGGVPVSGFASIYDSQSDNDAASGKEKTWSLFWSCLVPESPADRMIKKAHGDSDMLIGLLVDYFRKELAFGESLPTIVTSTKNNLRTGLLTSSIKPEGEWRKSDADSRIILLGDAVHPMTPGRGQGANQALTDAGKLIDLLRNSLLTDGDIHEQQLTRLIRAFDKEMYNRAFKMVKNSEQVTNIDLTTITGKIIAIAVASGLTLAGWAMTALETFGLKKVEATDFRILHPEV